MQVRMAAGATFCTIFRRSGLYQPLETVQSLSALCGSALRQLKLFQTMAQFAQGGSGQADS